MSINVGTALGYLDLDTSKFKKGISTALSDLKEFQKSTATVGSKISSVGSAFSSLGSSLTKNVTTPLTGVSSAMSAAAISVQSATSKISGYFGDVGDQAQRNEKILKDVFSSGIPSSLDETANAIIMVRKNLGDLDDASLENVTKQAIILDQKFDIDMNETLRGVNSLMVNFGMSAEEAMDYVVKGTQEGLDKTNELGDNLAEYGQLWSQAGFSAQEMFSILDNGLKSGAYNLDKVNDFVKEFTISLSDGRIEENINSFSDGTQRLFKEYQNGEATAKDVFNSVINDLETTMSKQDALTLASNTWSALGEDNALQVISALNDVNTSFDNVNGTAQQLTDTMQSGAGAALSELKNNVILLASTFGERLVPNIQALSEKLNDMVNYVKNMDQSTIDMIVTIGTVIAVLGPVLTILGKVISGIGTFVKVISTIKTAVLISTGAITKGSAAAMALSKVFLGISSVVGGVTKAIVGVGTAIVGTLGAPLTIVIGVIAALTAGFIYLWNTCDSFREFWINLWDSISSTLSGVGESVASFFTETLPQAFESFVSGISEFGSKISEFFTVTIPEAFNTFVSSTVPNFINSVIQWFQQLPYNIGYVIGQALGYIYIWGQNMLSWVATNIPIIIENIVKFFSELPGKIWKFLTEVVNNVITWGSQMLQNGISAASNFLNNVVELISQLPSKIWAFLQKVISNVVSWGSNMISQAISIASNFVTNFINFMKSLPDKVWGVISQIPSKITDIGKSLYNAGEEIMNKLWSGIKSVGENIKDWFSDFVSSIGDFVSGIIDGFNDVVRGADKAKSAAKSVDGSHANGLSYVPFDGYIAELHKGERVLTADEAKAYNAGVNRSGSSGGDTFNFYNTKPDPYEYARQMKKAKKELLYGF